MVYILYYQIQHADYVDIVTEYTYLTGLIKKSRSDTLNCRASVLQKIPGGQTKLETNHKSLLLSEYVHVLSKLKLKLGIYFVQNPRVNTTKYNQIKNSTQLPLQILLSNKKIIMKLEVTYISRLVFINWIVN